MRVHEGISKESVIIRGVTKPIFQTQVTYSVEKEGGVLRYYFLWTAQRFAACPLFSALIMYVIYRSYILYLPSYKVPNLL